jgi:hypothetical protein
MLTWLSNKLQKPQSDHPMASAASVAQIIDGIPTSNAPKALIEFTEWLSTAIEAPELSLEERVRAIGMLDEAAQPLCAEIDDKLIEGQHVKGVQAWFSLINYYGRVAAAYRACLDLFARREPKVDDPIDPAFLMLRAIAAINHKKKLLHLRYRAIETAIWKELNWIFLFSNSLSLLRKSIKLYPDSKDQTNIAREYVAGLMYEIAPLGNLTPRQMNDLYTVVTQHSQLFAFRENKDADTPYFVDLARSTAPVRWREGLPEGRTFRYFGVGVAYSHLVALLKEFQRSAKPPDWLAPLDEEADEEAFLHMMRALCAHWSTKPPARRHQRSVKRSSMQVTHGFRNVRAMIAGVAKVTSDDDPILMERIRMERLGFGIELADEVAKKAAKAKSTPATTMEAGSEIHLVGSKETIENWILQDESETGVGGLAPKHVDWLKVNMLVAYREDGVERWTVGVVRRFEGTTQNQVSVGIECLHGETICPYLGVLDKSHANIWDPTHNVGDTKIYGYVDAILLPETTSLLVEPNIYISGRRFLLSIQTQKKFIRFADLIEKGADYEHVRFIETDKDGNEPVS